MLFNTKTRWWDVQHQHWNLVLVRGQAFLRWNPNASLYEDWVIPDDAELDAAIQRGLLHCGVTTFRVEQLSPKPYDALCIQFSLPGSQLFSELYPVLLDLFTGLKVDFCLQPARCEGLNPIKPLWLSDMDSTLLEGECIDELADLIGIKAQVAEITEKAMQGDYPFENALIERVALLKGLQTTSIETVLQHTPLMAGARTLAVGMKQQGSFGVVVSGGFTPFTESVCATLGMNAHHANRLEAVNDIFTGRVIPPIVGKEAKVEALHHYANAQGIDLDNTLAIGDGANDLPMLQASGLGIAYHAKPAVNEGARASIRFNDLSAVLYYQGLHA